MSRPKDITATQVEIDRIISSENDYYNLISVDSSATTEEIAKAYKAKALIIHPDKVPSDQRASATKAFQLLHAAYTVLIDPMQKSNYDLQRLSVAGRPAVNPKQAAVPIPSTFDMLVNREKAINFISKIPVLESLKWLVKLDDQSISIAAPDTKENLQKQFTNVQALLSEAYKSEVVLRQSSRGGWIINISMKGVEAIARIAEKMEKEENIFKVKQFLPQQPGLESFIWTVKLDDLSLSLHEPLQNKDVLLEPLNKLHEMVGEDLQKHIVLRQSSRGGWTINIAQAGLAAIVKYAEALQQDRQSTKPRPGSM